LKLVKKALSNELKYYGWRILKQIPFKNRDTIDQILNTIESSGNDILDMTTKVDTYIEKAKKEGVE